MGSYTTVLDAEDRELCQFKTGEDYCMGRYVVGAVVNIEPDGIYEGLGSIGPEWAELYEVVIRGGVLVNCTRKPEGSAYQDNPNLFQRPFSDPGWDEWG